MKWNFPFLLKYNSLCNFVTCICCSHLLLGAEVLTRAFTGAILPPTPDTCQGKCCIIHRRANDRWWDPFMLHPSQEVFITLFTSSPAITEGPEEPYTLAWKVMGNVLSFLGSQVQMKVITRAAAKPRAGGRWSLWVNSLILEIHTNHVRATIIHLL